MLSPHELLFFLSALDSMSAAGRQWAFITGCLHTDMLKPDDWPFFVFCLEALECSSKFVHLQRRLLHVKVDAPEIRCKINGLLCWDACYRILWCEPICENRTQKPLSQKLPGVHNYHALVIIRAKGRFIT